MLNLSDGGVTLETAYYNMDDIDNLLYINEELISLLEYGIIPMNNLDVFHADIKEANVLYNTESNHVGLIDWGLSFQYKNHIPSKECHLYGINHHKPTLSHKSNLPIKTLHHTLVAQDLKLF